MPEVLYPNERWDGTNIAYRLSRVTVGASDLHILSLVFFGYGCTVTKGHECLL